MILDRLMKRSWGCLLSMMARNSAIASRVEKEGRPDAGLRKEVVVRSVSIWTGAPWVGKVWFVVRAKRSKVTCEVVGTLVSP